MTTPSAISKGSESRSPAGAQLSSKRSPLSSLQFTGAVKTL